MPTIEQINNRVENITELFRSHFDTYAPRVYFEVATIDQLDCDEPCGHCSDEHAAAMQVYYRSISTGQHLMAEGGISCMLRLIVADADADVTVRIEVAR